MDHFGHPVHGRIGVAAPQAFDEGADRIEMVVALLVVEYDPLLDRLFGDGEGDVEEWKLEIRRWGDCVSFVDSTLQSFNFPLANFFGFRRLHRQLQRIEHRAGVAGSHVDQMVERVGVQDDVAGAVAPLGIAQGLEGDGAQVVFGQRRELKDTTAADQRLVDFEIGIFSGGADEDDGPVLDPGQEGVLLGLVEAVDLVDEKNRAPAVVLGPILGLGHRFADVFDAGKDGVQRGKVGAGCVGNDPGQGRLAGSRRSVEDEAAQLVGLNRPAQEAARPDDVVLADILIQRPRSHARGQGRFLFQPVGVGMVEEIHGRIILRTMPMISSMQYADGHRC